MRRITHIIVHHNGYPGRTVEDIRRTHLAKGWRDIGYHAVVYRDGSVHAGRPLQQPGAHVKDLNANTLGLCLIGNGNKRPFPARQLQAARDQIRAWMLTYNVPSAHVLGHRETGHLVPPASATTKECPGTKLDMDKFRATLDQDVE